MQQDSRMGTMGQFGFFDADRRLAAITAKGDPLEMIAGVVPFESFRAENRGGGVDAGEREEEHRRPQADRRLGYVWYAGTAIALQSVGRTGRVSSARPPALDLWVVFAAAR